MALWEIFALSSRMLKFFFPAGKYLGGEVRRGGRLVPSTGSGDLPRVLFYKTRPAKGRTSPWKVGLLETGKYAGKGCEKGQETLGRVQRLTFSLYCVRV